MVIVLSTSDNSAVDDSTDIIKATVTVKDIEAGTVESLYSHSITVSLTYISSFSGTVLDGTKTMSTTAGVAELPNLKILSSGTFDFTATSTGLDPIPVRVTIVNHVKTITLSGPSTTELYTKFTILVAITGNDDNPYISSKSVTLVANPSASVTITSNPQTNFVGSLQFTVYSTTSSVSFTATVADSAIVSNSLSIAFNTPLLKLSASPTVFFI